MTQNNEQFTFTNELEISRFGLNGDFVESLTPTDFKGVILAIAKYAAKSRHPDNSHEFTSYDFGNTDARKLTAFAGRIAQLSDEEIIEIKSRYSEETIIEQQAQQISALISKADDQTYQLETQRQNIMDLLSESPESTNIAGYSGSIYCASNDYLDKNKLLNIYNIDLSPGGAIKNVKEYSVFDKAKLSHSEEHFEVIYQAMADRFDKINTPILIVIDSMGAVIQFQHESFSMDDLGLDDGILPTTKNKRLFSIRQTQNSKTYLPGEPVVLSYTQKPKKCIIAKNSHVLGFMKYRENIIDQYQPETPQIAGSLTGNDVIGIFERISTHALWVIVNHRNNSFNRDVGESYEMRPVIYQAGNTKQECLLLGNTLLSVPK